MAEFGKKLTCPSAETLLAYNEAPLPVLVRQATSAHLRACDFCGAALELLSKHPAESGSQQALEEPSIPLAVWTLAHQLRQRCMSPLPIAASNLC